MLKPRCAASHQHHVFPSLLICTRVESGMLEWGGLALRTCPPELGHPEYPCRVRYWQAL